ncbi:MAG: sigma-70 family RNA polymerase sigma factor [Myxococcales bacterium]|nr:sigma-70 family RNA polymerase sigma factor [Myxococcales bacterium]
MHSNRPPGHPIGSTSPCVTHRTDEDLVAAWTAGCSAAGELLFSRHYAAVRRFLGARLRGTERLDDLTQRTFLGCLEAKTRFRGESSFRTFLLSIANNQLRRYLYERARDERHALLAPHCQPSEAGRPDRSLESLRREQRLRQAFSHLSDDQRYILDLFYWQDLTTRQISALLSVPRNTIKTQLRRARLRLERVLRRYELYAGRSRPRDPTTCSPPTQIARAA